MKAANRGIKRKYIWSRIRTWLFIIYVISGSVITFVCWLGSATTSAIVSCTRNVSDVFPALVVPDYPVLHLIIGSAIGINGTASVSRAVIHVFADENMWTVYTTMQFWSLAVSSMGSIGVLVGVIPVKTVSTPRFRARRTYIGSTTSGCKPGCAWAS